MNELAAFYEMHYKTVGSWTLQPGHKIFLGDKETRRCRFCGKGGPEVSFRDEAPAIPECVGNKSLFTYHECDSCNQAFGRGCENDFGNWSLPMRTMARIRGKSSVPTIKHDAAGKLRIDSHPDGLEVSVNEAEGFFEDNPETKIRRREDFVAPYAYVLLRYGNEMLQMAVPSPEKDGALNGKMISLPPYPCTSKEDSAGNSTQPLPFVSMDFVRDEEVVLTMSYGEQRPR